MSNYATRPHLGCACTKKKGELLYEKTISEQIVMSRWAVKNSGAAPKTRWAEKDMFRCSVCKELIWVKICPSWKDYKLWEKQAKEAVRL